MDKAEAKTSRIPKPSGGGQKDEPLRRKSVKINKARPAPDFTKLHHKWQTKLHDGLVKSKKPCTVPEGFDLAQSRTITGRHREKSESENNSEPMKEEAVMKESSVDKAKSKQAEEELRKSARKTGNKTQGIMKSHIQFRADPEALAQILNSENTKKPDMDKKHTSTRLSIYDIAMQRRKTRTPLRNLDNISHTVESPNMTSITKPTPRSIYKKSAKKTPLTVYDKVKLLSDYVNSGGNCKMTWSEKLSKHVADKETEQIKLQLNFDDQPDNVTTSSNDIDQSMMDRLEQAQQMMIAELGQDEKATKHNKTYVKVPAQPSVLTNPSQLLTEETSELIGLLNSPENRLSNTTLQPRKATPKTGKSKQLMQSQISPVVTGVARLAGTPVNKEDVTISQLMSNICIASTNRKANEPLSYVYQCQSDGASPALAYQDRRTTKKNRETLPPAQINNPLEPRISLVEVSTPDKPLIPTTELHIKTPIKPDMVLNSSPLTDGHVALNQAGSKTVKTVDELLDVSRDLSGEIPPIMEINELKTSPELTETMNQIDRQIVRSRRRSAALVTTIEPAELNNDLQLQLEKILAHQQALERQKLEIQSKLISLRCDQTIKADKTLDDQSISNVSNMSIIAGQIGDTMSKLDLSAHELLELDDEISFLPPPAALQMKNELRPISTGVMEAGKKKRESLNLMVFSPTLKTLKECYAEESVDTTLPSSKAEHRELVSQIELQAPKLDMLETFISLNNTLPSMTVLSQPQGWHLLLSPTRAHPTVSPQILRLQSQHIAQVDCIKQGVNTSYNAQLLLNLNNSAFSALSSSQMGIKSDAETGAANICRTPVARRNGGTIGIYSPECTPVQSPNLSPKPLIVNPQEHSLGVSPVFGAGQSTLSSEPSSTQLVDQSCSPTLISVTPKNTTPNVTADNSEAGKDSSENLLKTPKLYSSYKPGLTSLQKYSTDVKPLRPTTGFSIADKYRQALLDDEVSVFMSKFLTLSIEQKMRDLNDPVAFCLQFGDERHFIPILSDGDKTQRKPVSVSGSAFHIYT